MLLKKSIKSKLLLRINIIRIYKLINKLICLTKQLIIIISTYFSNLKLHQLKLKKKIK